MPSPYKQRRQQESVIPERSGPSLGEMVSQAYAQRGQQQMRQDQSATDMMQMAMRMRQMQQDQSRQDFYQALAKAQEGRAQAGEQRAVEREGRAAQSHQLSQQLSMGQLEMQQQSLKRSESADASREALANIFSLTSPLKEGLANRRQMTDASRIGISEMAQGRPETMRLLQQTHGELVEKRFGEARKKIAPFLAKMDPEMRAKAEPAILESLAKQEEMERNAFLQISQEEIDAIARPNALADAIAAATAQRKETKAHTIQLDRRIAEGEQSSPLGVQTRWRSFQSGPGAYLLGSSLNVGEIKKYSVGLDGQLNGQIVSSFNGIDVINSIMGRHHLVADRMLGSSMGNWSVSPTTQTDPLVSLFAFPIEAKEDGSYAGASRTVTIDGKTFKFEADPETLKRYGDKLQGLKAQFVQISNKGPQGDMSGKRFEEMLAAGDKQPSKSVIGTLVYNNLLASGPKGNRDLPASVTQEDVIRGRDYIQALRDVWDGGRLTVTGRDGKPISYAKPWSQRSNWLHEQGIMSQSTAEGRATSEGALAQQGFPGISRDKVISISKMVALDLRKNPVVSKIQASINDVRKGYKDSGITLSPDQEATLISETFDQALEALLASETEGGDSELLRRFEESGGDLMSGLDTFIEDVVKPHAYTQFNRDPALNQRNYERREQLRRTMLGQTPSSVPGQQRDVYRRFDEKKFSDDIEKQVMTLLMDDRRWLETVPHPAGKIPSSVFMARPDITNTWNTWGTAVPGWFEGRMTSNPDMMDLVHTISMVQQDLFRNPGGMNPSTLSKAMNVLGQPGPFTQEDALDGGEYLDRRSRALKTLLETNGKAMQDPLVRTIAAWINAIPNPQQSMPLPNLGQPDIQDAGPFNPQSGLGGGQALQGLTGGR